MLGHLQRPVMISRLADTLRSARPRRTATQFLLALATATVSRLGLLAMAVLVSRELGPAGYGVFNFATGVAMFGSQIISLGWPNLMNRLLPAYRSTEQWSLFRGFVRAASLTVVGASLISALGLVAVAPLFPKLAEGFALAAVLLPLMALVILRRQQLAAVGKAAMGLLFDQGFGAIVATVILLLFGVSSVASSVLHYAVAIIFGIVVTTVIFHRSLPSEAQGKVAEYRYAYWMTLAIPIMVGLASRQMLFRTDILLLAPMSTLDQVGLYGAAVRLTYVLAFPQAVLMLVMTPRIAEAIADGRTSSLRRLLLSSYLMVLATAIPLVVPLALFPAEVMIFVYGEAFADGATILLFLALGQFGASLAIPTQSLLTMGGRERPFAALNLLGFAVNALLCVVLIPHYGAKGAAICTAFSAWLQFLAQALVARHLLGRTPNLATLYAKKID